MSMQGSFERLKGADIYQQACKGLNFLTTNMTRGVILKPFVIRTLLHS